jgi:hypothetical protein
MMIIMRKDKHTCYFVLEKITTMGKSFIKRIMSFVLTILLIWGILTLWVEWQGPNKLTFVGAYDAPKRALVVYDPDPIYDLDAQVCQRFAAGLAADGQWQISLSSVSSAEKLSGDFDLYVFCANTYNWAPDWAISRFIRRRADLEDKPVIAITIGSGSTTRAQRLLESKIKNKDARLMTSSTYWLMRPNDDTKSAVSNVLVACNQAERLGIETAHQLAKK